MADRVAKAAGISSEAAQAKTGKSLDEWFALLDKAGAADWPHKEIVAHLYDVCGCPGWWCQSPPSISVYVKNQLKGVNGAWGNVDKSGRGGGKRAMNHAITTQFGNVPQVGQSPC